MGWKRGYEITSEEEDEIVKLYSEGMSAGKIGGMFNISDEAVYNVLKRRGIDRRSYSEAIRRYTVKEDAFDNIDDEEVLYWFAFLQADGYVVDSNQHFVTLMLAKKDREHVEKFREFVGSNKRVAEYIDNSYNKESRKAYLIVNSERLVKRLVELGLDKQHKNTFPSWMTEERFKPWLRGLIDGDGWVGYVHSKGYTYLGIGLVGYPDLINGVMDWLVKILGVRRNAIRKTKSDKVVYIQWWGKDAEKIANYIYSDAKIYLDRKYNKWRDWVDGKVYKGEGVKAKGGEK